ncbi:glutathione S-transferase 2 [Folsomia candida]|uniref:glutathione transferase n=1 Tax=Folsomia candida TaxID=158441 RepID=A0A226E7N4_FOLCA|nr:glutathione S-transferase 2 [Folsomia candida]OXA53605.1 Glutathione S-transferase 2 [Folsomia candida]
MGKPKLAYWDIRGLAQKIRFALAYMGVDYDDLTYKEDNEQTGGDNTWASDKTKLGLIAPNLPYWIDDDVKITESNAILKYVVRKYNPSMIPSNLAKLAEMDMIEGILADIMTYSATAAYSGEDKKEEHSYTFGSVVPTKLVILSKILGDKKFLMGNEPSYIDFPTYEILYMLTKFRPSVVQAHENLTAYMISFEKLPAIEAYMKSPQFIKGPWFSRHCPAKI